MGQLVGGLFGVFLFYAIWEYLLFKRIMDDPVKGKFLSVIAGYLTASILYGYLSANGGPFNPDGFLIYLLGAAVVGFFAIRRGLKLRDEIDSGGDLTETFN